MAYSNKKFSELYAKFRPVYPPCVAGIITSYMKSEECSGFNIAVDVACGSGQSTFLLSDSFQKVIGVDISKTQIEQAKLKCTEDGFTNIELLTGDAHEIPVKSSSVDLLTCAMAWHWLDAEKFYAECKRVLKPQGCIAVYGHGVQVFDNERINKALSSYREEIFRSNCFTAENHHILNKYKAVELPFKQTQRVEFDLPQQATIDQVLGLISSVSMYTTYCEKFPNNTLLKNIRDDYEADSSKEDVETFTFPGFLLLGQK